MSSNTRQACHNIGSWVQIQVKDFTISLGHEFNYKSNISQYSVVSSDTSLTFHNIIMSWVHIQVKKKHNIIGSWVHIQVKKKHNIIGSWVQILVEHFTKLLGHEFKYKSNISVHYIIRSWVRIQIHASKTFHKTRTSQMLYVAWDTKTKLFLAQHLGYTFRHGCLAI